MQPAKWANLSRVTSTQATSSEKWSVEIIVGTRLVRKTDFAPMDKQIAIESPLRSQIQQYRNLTITVITIIIIIIIIIKPLKAKSSSRETDKNRQQYMYMRNVRVGIGVKTQASWQSWGDREIYYQSSAALKANFISSPGLSIVLIYATVHCSLWWRGHFFHLRKFKSR